MVVIHRTRINVRLVPSTISIESISIWRSQKSYIIEDINGLIMCSNVPKLSDYAKKKKKKVNYRKNNNKNICFINQDLTGFEPTGECHIDLLVKTI